MTDELDLDAIKEKVAFARRVQVEWTIPEWSRALAEVAACAEPLIAEVERLRSLRPETTQAVVAHMNRAEAAEAAIARVREAVSDPIRSTCPATVVRDGIEQPCGREVTGWCWYEGDTHEPSLYPACRLHENEGGRRMGEAEAAIARVRELHQPYPVYAYDSTNGVWKYDEHGRQVQIDTICDHCTPDETLELLGDCEWTQDDEPGVSYPCPTTRALDGEVSE